MNDKSLTDQVQFASECCSVHEGMEVLHPRPCLGRPMNVLLSLHRDQAIAKELNGHIWEATHGIQTRLAVTGIARTRDIT